MGIEEVGMREGAGAEGRGWRCEVEAGGAGSALGTTAAEGDEPPNDSWRSGTKPCELEADVAGAGREDVESPDGRPTDGDDGAIT